MAHKHYFRDYYSNSSNPFRVKTHESTLMHTCSCMRRPILIIRPFSRRLSHSCMRAHTYVHLRSFATAQPCNMSSQMLPYSLKGILTLSPSSCFPTCSYEERFASHRAAHLPTQMQQLKSLKKGESVSSKYVLRPQQKGICS